jgi:hypothetical protein
MVSELLTYGVNESGGRPLVALASPRGAERKTATSDVAHKPDIGQTWQSDAIDPFRTFPCLLAFRPGLPKLHTARPKSAIGFWSGHILAMRGCRRRVRGRNRVIARRRAAHAGLSAQEPEPLGKARWRRVITSGHNGLTSLDSLRPRKCFGCLFSAPASCRAERRLWRG